MRFILLAVSCCLLSSCASMSKDECLYADWRAIGYEDGANGYPATAVSARRQACAKAGVTPDMGEYLAGRDQGLNEYCTPANGFATGERGVSYSGACGRHDEASFLEHYRAGSFLYSLRDKAERADEALYAAIRDLDSVRFEIAQTSLDLVRPELTVADRAVRVVELAQLTEENRLIERAIPGLRMDVAAAEAELDGYETQLASRPTLVRARIALR
jgi:hypothetical protein